MTRFHPRRLLELLSEGGDLPPEKSVEASGGSPDVGVVYRVTVNVLVAHCSYAVTALQLVGELSSGSEINMTVSIRGRVAWSNLWKSIGWNIDRRDSSTCHGSTDNSNMWERAFII